MYSSGRGVAQSDMEAAVWFKKAAARGYAKAQCALGEMLKNGRGIAQSDLEAAHWFQKAADQGFDITQAILKT